MPTGSVVRFDRRRGYGFVQPDDGGEDVFVHQNNIIMDGFRFLQVGERVSYELEVGEKGMKAVSVTLTEPRVERNDRDDQDAGGGDRDDMDRGDRPRFQRQDRGDRGGDRAAFTPRAPRGGDDRGDKAARKLERVISILVAKGIIAPGEVDGIEGVAKAAEQAGQ